MLNDKLLGYVFLRPLAFECGCCEDGHFQEMIKYKNGTEIVIAEYKAVAETEEHDKVELYKHSGACGSEVKLFLKKLA